MGTQAAYILNPGTLSVLYAPPTLELMTHLVSVVKCTVRTTHFGTHDLSGICLRFFCALDCAPIPSRLQKRCEVHWSFLYCWGHYWVWLVLSSEGALLHTKRGPSW